VAAEDPRAAVLGVVCLLEEALVERPRLSVGISCRNCIDGLDLHRRMRVRPNEPAVGLLGRSVPDRFEPPLPHGWPWYRGLEASPAKPTTPGREILGKLPPNVELLAPVGYLDMAALVSQARVLVTDSGGLQKEAYWYGVPCVTARPSTEWIDTVELGANVLVDDDPEKLAAAVASARMPEDLPPLYGDGHAAERVAASLADRG
jgi:hypothetical protein